MINYENKKLLNYSEFTNKDIDLEKFTKNVNQLSNFLIEQKKGMIKSNLVKLFVSEKSKCKNNHTHAHDHGDLNEMSQCFLDGLK